MAKDQECLYRNSTECIGAQKDEVSEPDQHRKLEKDRGEEEAKEKDRCKMNEYREKDKETKRSFSKDKRHWVNNVAQEAEDAAHQGQMIGVYEATRRLFKGQRR